MRIYYKVTSFCFSFIVVTLLYLVTTSAYTLSPNTGNLQQGQSYLITVYADPGNSGSDTSAEVQLLRSNSNITITAATPSNSGTLAAGVCSGGGTYNASNVCFIFGNNAGIDSGDILGTFSITASSIGTVSLSSNSSDAAYEPSGEVVSGVLATFNVVASGGLPTNLPNTSFTSSAFIDALLLFIGVTSISVGIYFYYYLPKFRYEVVEASEITNKFEYKVLRRKLDKRNS